MKRLIARLFAFLLTVGILMPMLPVTADAAGESSSLTLKQPDSGELKPFHVTNMFPGDSITREYTVETRHDRPIVLNYHADIRPDEAYEKLAEVLMIRIEAQGASLYDGLMASMPAALTRNLPAGTNQVTYRITAYLPTSVGNAYMNKELFADFRWWFLEDTGAAVTITAEKLMNGQYPRGSSFSFALKDETGKTVSTVKNDDGHIEFDTLYLDAPGTYTYTIQEVKGTDSKVIYDTAVYTAVIQVAADESYRVTYLRNGADYGTKLPRFLNRTRGSSGSDDPGDYHPSNPKTGDPFPLMLVSTICGSSLCLLVCLLLLWGGRKKEEGGHA